MNASPKAYRPNGYTDEQMQSDTSFLVGTRFGRADTKTEVLKAIHKSITPDYPIVSGALVDLLLELGWTQDYLDMFEDKKKKKK